MEAKSPSLSGSGGTALPQHGAAQISLAGDALLPRPPDAQELYRAFLKKPPGQRSHELLHTDHNSWEMPTKLPE